MCSQAPLAYQLVRYMSGIRHCLPPPAQGKFLTGSGSERVAHSPFGLARHPVLGSCGYRRRWSALSHGMYLYGKVDAILHAKVMTNW